MNLHSEKKSVATKKGSIVYFAAGPKDAPRTAMLLHGLSSNHTTWLNFMERFATENIRTIVPDLRGHGFSDQSKKRDWYDFSVFADDLAAIAEQEQLSAFDLTGYSFGGYVAITYAAAHPEKLRSLALVSANFMNPLRYGRFSPIAPAAAAFVDSLAWLTYPQWLKNYPYFEHGKSTGYLDSTLKGLITMPLSVNFWMLARTLRLDLSDALPRIACPTLIVRSASDPYLTEREVKDMARKIERARAVTIESDSHYLASRDQDELARELLPFIADPASFIQRP